MAKWTCRGSIRGECGVTHRSAAAAEAHCARDGRDCREAGGYSDRTPTLVEPDYGRIVSEPDQIKPRVALRRGKRGLGELVEYYPYTPLDSASFAAAVGYLERRAQKLGIQVWS